MRNGLGEQSSQNLLIEGDNLHVLGVLAPANIDLVYIDPPYNTGKKFRYNDCWNHASHLEEIFVTEVDAGHHVHWVNFMVSRLRLLKRLLKPSGVIAVSIGKEELFRLGLLMDDLFGEANQVGLINWQKRYSPSNDSRHISDATEYVLIYAKERTGAQSASWDNPCLDADSLCTGTIPLVPFPPSWYSQPLQLGCQSWGYVQSGHTQGATKLLNAIMGAEHQFATPKPLKLIEKIIQLWCPSDGVVLDAFAGSGTTGHAVLDLNALGASRRFILIEQGNAATGDRFAQTLTAERLRRVITGEWAAGKRSPLPGEFVFQALTESMSDERSERGAA